ncbi:NAD-dependent epimerase/dehydratase family protein [bacterium]|nr:NAD-dependent epimerase/dehydratase family protein [bacterium]
MATYLVTGVAGFVGSHVTQSLLADGHHVIGIDNLNDAYDVRLKDWRLSQFANHEAFDFHHIDIGDRLALDVVFNEAAKADRLPEGIINLAARAGVPQSVANPWIYFATNTTGTLNLLDLCKEYGVSKFVLASTSSLYGKGNPMPYSEEANTDLALSPYSASKKAAETLCYTYHHLYNIDVTIFRYFTVFGPAGRPEMSLFRFVQWINEGRPLLVYGDGQQSRDFTYIDDIARGTIAGLKRVGYEIVNLGSDKPIVLMDAIHMIEELTGKQAKIQHAETQSTDVRASWANIEKANRLLGWQPQMPFIEGVERLVDWYATNRSWASQLVTV